MCVLFINGIQSNDLVKCKDWYLCYNKRAHKKSFADELSKLSHTQGME